LINSRREGNCAFFVGGSCKQYVNIKNNRLERSPILNVDMFQRKEKEAKNVSKVNKKL
jgi:hypothetical protein